jgi:NAD(P)H-hydrate epimerase
MINLTRQQARKIDHLAINDLGIPSIVLMENAGKNATDAIQHYMQRQGKELKSALLFCGGGNNAGDGFVSARHLHNQGITIQIIATKPIDQLAPDAAINATICQNMNLNIQPAPAEGASAPVSSNPQPDVIIDALLGTGFQGHLRPDILQLIQTINATKTQPNPPVICAIDLPSGLDCDTGQPPQNDIPDHPAQPAVRADLTITFVAPKLGFTNPAAKPYLGQVQVVHIGTPPQLLNQITRQ